MVLALKIIMLFIALGLIATVVLQSGKSAGLSGAIAGGAEQLMGRQKARGLDALLGKLTVILSVVFFVLALLIGFFV